MCMCVYVCEYEYEHNIPKSPLYNLTPLLSEAYERETDQAETQPFAAQE